MCYSKGKWVQTEGVVFPVREVRPWHRVPREAVPAPGSLEVSKGEAWDSGRCPCPQQGWHWMIFKIPPNPFWDAVKDSHPWQMRREMRL